ncbi:cellulose binding domain-containing protein [Virgisporangium ochraceum]
MRISSRAQGNLAEWRDWTTPSLGQSPSNPPSSQPPSSQPPSSQPPSSQPPSSGPPSSSGPPPVGGCAASVSVNAWTGGFVATVRVTAGASPVDGWTVAMTLPAGATITNSWNTTRGGTTGAVTLSNVSYNGRLGAGQSTEFGFQGTGSPGNPAPTCTAS